MTITRNTLRLITGVWQDPGDYPNSCAGVALRSRPVAEDVAGEVVVALDASDAGLDCDTFNDELNDLLARAVSDCWPGLRCEMQGEIKQGRLTFTAGSFDVSGCEPFEPDEEGVEE